MFDAVAALLSEPIDFRYEDVFWISLAIYTTAGFFAGHRLGSLGGAARTSALVGLADATVGWIASYLIEPDLYGYADDPTPALIAVVAALVVGIAAMLGAVGGAIAKRVRHSRA